ncbi:hypothetical protein O6H91_21G007000 [Diphasiastrum complanatum]|uniref:Uncharacterized protein n=1 Tax=Diphasiastrum complanatum TaxID=34168 RepID=A0ACC2AHH4_DIPCM|nr:hypothetical protein O6H91_21G007000 [Diphasiastrum complanatum]
MHSAGKASPRWGNGQLVEELRAREDADRKVQESLDTLFRQTMGDSYASLTSRSGEKPVQCIYWPDAFDQQLASRLTRGLKVETGLEMRDEGADGNFPAGLREYTSTAMNGIGGLGKTLQASGERLHSLKVPQAVVAFAQAAVKVNDLAGWPLLSPAKIQMQKCEKCSQEFYSPLNYKRHSRIHRRLLHANKEDLKKEMAKIAAFWNKLTFEEASQILSIKNTVIEDLSGSATVRALTALIRQPGLSLLPQTFVKSGTALLDVVQSKGSTRLISADELFSILDDASESTFLCGGITASVQRFVYRGEAAKLGLEDRNLLASLAFLIEQKLVKAWMIDKDAEALRCQKELVEEEEAAQKRREKLLEKKHKKKLRQKEKEKKEASLRLVFDDQENDVIDDDRILRLEEGDSPSASGSSSVSLSSSGHDLNQTQSSDLQMAQFVAQLEEKILLKSMHTFDRLVRSAYEEDLEDEEHHNSKSYILSSQEQSISELVNGQMNTMHKIEDHSILEAAEPLYDDQVHQETSPALFQDKDELSKSENKFMCRYSKSLSYQKFSHQLKKSDENHSSQKKAGKVNQERVRSEQLESSLQSTRNFSDVNSTEDKYLGGPYMNKLSSKKSHLILTNGMRVEQSVSVTTVENNVLPPKLQHYRSKLSKPSKASVNVLSGNTVWAIKTPLSPSVDPTKNVGEGTVNTATCSDQTDNINIEFSQILPAETPKNNKIRPDEREVISSPTDTFSSSKYEPNDLDTVHEIRLKSSGTSRSVMQGSSLEPYVHAEETISDSATIQGTSNLSVGASVAMEESRVVSMPNVAENELSYVSNALTTFEPVESIEDALLIGSLKVPLTNLVAEAFGQKSSVLINGVILSSTDKRSVTMSRVGHNLHESNVRDILGAEDYPRGSELTPNSVSRNSSKASSISDGEKDLVQSAILFTNGQVSKPEALSNFGNSSALGKAARAARAVGTSGWDHQDETFTRSKLPMKDISTLGTSTLFGEQATTSHLRTGSLGNTSELDLNDPGQTVLASQNHVTSSYGEAQLMARERKTESGKWCKNKDGNLPVKLSDQRWLSISDVAVAAFLSDRWKLATKAMEAAAASA